MPLLQLRDVFCELIPSKRQCGLDDELHGWFADAWYSIGENLLAKAYYPLLVAFARRGVPAGLRRRVWLTAMHLEALPEQSYHYFEALKREVRRVALATDDMICNDVSSPSKEHDFFVFGDMVKEVLHAFCRDPAVAQLSIQPKPLPLISCTGSGQHAAFPPSEIPPGRGLSDYVFPLCFVYAQPVEVYYVFREMWTRYWCKLQSISSSQGTLLPLLRLFEDLLQESAPAVFWHLLRLQLNPCRIALPWIFSGFASYLPAEQTLLLWDRIIGFNNLELLAVTAAAVFVYRAKSLLQAHEKSHAIRLLDDATGLKVVPLLQLFLYDHSSLVILDATSGWEYIRRQGMTHKWRK